MSLRLRKEVQAVFRLRIEEVTNPLTVLVCTWLALAATVGFVALPYLVWEWWNKRK